jgi:hypothetical protein
MSCELMKLGSRCGTPSEVQVDRRVDSILMSITPLAIVLATVLRRPMPSMLFASVDIWSRGIRDMVCGDCLVGVD